MNRRCISAIILAAILVPKGALAGLYESVGWSEHSYYARRFQGIGAPGIGGLEVKIQDGLSLSSESLSYDDGYLSANLDSSSLAIPISSIELSEVVQLVRQNDQLVLQTSLDQTPLGNFFYRSPALRDTLFIGDLFEIADLEFAALVQGRLPIPQNGPLHPDEQAFNLLLSDDPYSELPNAWPKVPADWPRLYMTFMPSSPELVGMEFEPQLFFNNLGGHPVEVDDAVSKLAISPYLPLMEDVNSRPGLYREILPAVDRAAHITTALGLVAAACQQPTSCSQLLVESSDSELSSLIDDYISLERYQEEYQENFSEYGFRLRNLWNLLSLPEFEPGQSPQAWGGAYDTVQEYMVQFALSTVTDEPPDENPYSILASVLLESAQEQFLSYPIPEDALLQAAAAVVFSQSVEEVNAEVAIQSLRKALELSMDYPGSRTDVTRMGIFVGRVLSNNFDQEQGQAIIDLMRRVYDESLLDSYDEVDRYLNECLMQISNCPPSDLRTWEADAAKAGLTMEIEGRDIAWLNGRFAYLIGIQDPSVRVDRLRFLEAYSSLTTSEVYEEQLNEFTTTLSNMLESN